MVSHPKSNIPENFFEKDIKDFYKVMHKGGRHERTVV